MASTEKHEEKEKQETGADVMIRALLKSGIDVCFANPGTTEMPLVASLDAIKGVRCILGLHENVVTGAADGYARMSGKPAITLLHLGVGFANGMANMHNAKRALSPMINIIGEMSTWHRSADALLGMDIEKVASAVSGLVKTCNRPDRVVQDVVEAVQWCRKKRVNASRVVTMVVPHDTQRDAAHFNETDMEQLGGSLDVLDIGRPTLLEELKAEETLCGGSMRPELDEAAAALASASSKVILLGTHVCVDEEALLRASRVASATGCTLMCENAFARVERGSGRAKIQRLAYFPADAQKDLAKFQVVVVVGCRVPVAMFGYADGISHLVDYEKQKVFELNDTEDFAGVIEYLENKTAASGVEPRLNPIARPKMPKGLLTGAKLSAAIAATQPERAIIIDESLTSGGQYWDYSAGCPPFSHLTLTGGAIGIGPPMAVGAAVACPGRRVINFQADGSGMYTVQALWTQQREMLDIVTVICANQKYQILKIELTKQKLPTVGGALSSLTDLSAPAIDWVHLAQGCGVKAARVKTVEEFVSHMQTALAARGPYLIEAILM